MLPDDGLITSLPDGSPENEALLPTTTRPSFRTRNLLTPPIRKSISSEAALLLRSVTLTDKAVGVKFVFQVWAMFKALPDNPLPTADVVSATEIFPNDPLPVALTLP